jgi:hypothetical protein
MMKLNGFGDFKNNPLYLLALKMLRFHIRNVAVFFEGMKKAARPTTQGRGGPKGSSGRAY